MQKSENSTRTKVGIFTLVGLLAIAATTVLVNDHPYWWRRCQLVHINVEDATGLKTKSPVRSLGLEIGYLTSVELTETHVDLGICITAPVEVLPATRAYLRGEGFLGDKFVELKPVRYVGGSPQNSAPSQPVAPAPAPASSASPQAPATSRRSSGTGFGLDRALARLADALNPIATAEAADAWAAPAPSPSIAPSPAPPSAPVGTVRRGRRGDPGAERQIPVGEGSQDMSNVVNKVDSLVGEMTSLTNNLKQVMNPEELRDTMKRLNRTLENASRTLSPESGLNQTAQRTLAKLEDAIEQLRDVITRVNQGEGSVGMVLNDPSYAEELRKVIHNANQLLGKVNQVRFVPDVGAEMLTGYNSGRGWFRLGIWPVPDRYYLLGISIDPRGRRTDTTTITTVGGVTSTLNQAQIEQNGIVITGMLGKVLFNRLDLSVGVLHNDGAVSANLLLGTNEKPWMIQLRDDVYARTSGSSTFDTRVTLTYLPWEVLYFKVGMESIHQVNGQLPLLYGAGISFDDEHIKLLFALR